MCVPMSCSSAAYSSHSRSRSVEPVHRPRLIEERQREPHHLLRVFGVVVAPLGQLERAAPPHVGDAVDLRDVLAVATDVVEHQPFAQRQVAQRDVFGAEPAQDRVEQHARRRRRDRRGADRGPASSGAARDRESDDLLAQPANLLRADTRRLRSSLGTCAIGHRRGDGAQAQDRARRADHAVEAGAGDLLAVAVDLARGCAS